MPPFCSSSLALLPAGAGVAAVAAAPTAITGPVSAVGTTSATASGTVNPNGLSTSWYFEYGTSTAYGKKTATRSAGSGTTNVQVSATLTGLTPGTTYHYRLVAVNGDGTTRGADGVFTTSSAPVAVTGAASDVTVSSATLAGTVDPNGRHDELVLRVRDEHGLRVEDAGEERGLGHGRRGGLGGRVRPDGRAALPLPARRDQRRRDGPRCRPDLLDGRGAGGGHRVRQLRHDEGGEAERQGDAERPDDDLVLRVRHDDGLRHQDARQERRQGHEPVQTSP